jgi:hypothetical protein
MCDERTGELEPGCSAIQAALVIIHHLQVPVANIKQDSLQCMLRAVHAQGSAGGTSAVSCREGSRVGAASQPITQISKFLTPAGDRQRVSRAFAHARTVVHHYGSFMYRGGSFCKMIANARSKWLALIQLLRDCEMVELELLRDLEGVQTPIFGIQVV